MKRYKEDLYTKDKSNMIIYSTPKELFDYVNEIGNIIDINTRSGVVKFIIKQYYDEFKYLTDNDSIVYIFLDYLINSYAGNDLLKVILKYNLEILSNKSHGDGINRMILSTNNAIEELNKVIGSIIKVDGVLLIKFIGV